ncbi:unnamed protein product [Chironomus riparius]|uniref:Uncharacterized protein n=1 Tax=Chironomus riparius TaxID=315576 RepID=A0A9N9WZ94_9DIPT|nr:unnamed protein product [Chironomus riparius]
MKLILIVLLIFFIALVNGGTSTYASTSSEYCAYIEGIVNKMPALEYELLMNAWFEMYVNGRFLESVFTPRFNLGVDIIEAHHCLVEIFKHTLPPQSSVLSEVPPNSHSTGI